MVRTNALANLRVRRVLWDLSHRTLKILFFLPRGEFSVESLDPVRQIDLWWADRRYSWRVDGFATRGVTSACLGELSGHVLCVAEVGGSRGVGELVVDQPLRLVFRGVDGEVIYDSHPPKE